MFTLPEWSAEVSRILLIIEFDKHWVPLKFPAVLRLHALEY